MVIPLVLILNFFFLFVAGQNEFYMGYKVYNVKLETLEQQESFHLLKSDLIDYWRKPSLKHGVVGKAMVPPSHFEWFEGQLGKLGMNRDIAIEDLYEYLNSRKTKSWLWKANENDFDIYNYYRYEEILEYIKSLEYDYTNSTQVSVSVVQAGETDEKRPLMYIKVKSVQARPDIPIAVIEAAIIPRDWITVPCALNILHNLLKEKNSLINDYEWVIIPVLNPDGYEYTHTNLRLWTKNRSTRSDLGLICPGVNINRNFNTAWKISDSSSSPCSHVYSGVESFSEPESKFLKLILEEFKDRIRLYMSLHNSGDSIGFISYPWQFEKAASGMFRQHHLLGLDMVRAINGTYKLDVGFAALGDRASGTGSDYFMKEGVLYTYNIGIIQDCEDCIDVPIERIRHVVDDIWKAVEKAAHSLSLSLL